MSQSTTKIMIEVGMPTPEVSNKPEIKCPPLEDEVRDALDLIDSGYKSDVEWVMINKLYAELCSLKNPSDRAKNLLNMINPVLAKFGYHGKGTK